MAPDTDRTIREHRIAAGLSQQQLAEMVRCSISMIGLLERGYRPAHSEVLGQITAMLNHVTEDIDKASQPKEQS